MKSIALTQGKLALVDDGDYDFLSQWKWSAVKIKQTYYATRGIWNGIKIKVIYMHRLIMDVPDGVIIDHRDNDGLNNQRNNLRECNQAQNKRNSGKQKNNTSGYLGVTFKNGKFQSRITFEGRRLYLGRFDNVIDAAKAYDEAAKMYYGEFAYLNFK